MSAENIRLGLIGCGYMGNYYAHNISRLEDAEICMACDPSPGKLERFCGKWNISEKATDWEMLMRKRPDGIINCTVDSIHAGVFSGCMNNNIPLMTEKPPAVPLDLFEASAGRRMDSRKFLDNFVINFSKRCLPAIPLSLDMLRTGKIGRLQRMELHYRQGWLVNKDFGDWLDNSSWFWRLTSFYSHYGVLGDLGSHMLDLAVYYCGRPRSISCSLYAHKKGPDSHRGKMLDSADEAVCVLRFDDVLCIVNLTRSAAGEKDSMVIMLNGTEGSIRIEPEHDSNGLEFFKKGSDNWTSINSDRRQKRNFEYFISGLRSSEALISATEEYPGFQDAVVNQVLLDAASEASESGREIVIEDFISDKPEIKKIWLTGKK